MTDWAGFVGFAGVVLASMLALAWLSRDAIDAESTARRDDEAARRDHEAARREFNRVMGGPAPGPGEPHPGEPDDLFSGSSGTGSVDSEVETESIDSETGTGSIDAGQLSTGTLLANVILTQGLFFGVLVAGIWWTDVPPSALGLAVDGTSIPAVETTSLGWGVETIVLGTALGTGLYVFNQLGAALGERVGVGSSTALREALAPSSTRGWVGLFGVVLPVVAVFEELLFRGVLIGGLAVAGVELGATVSPWLLVGISSIAFALGHGAQGQGGIVVTGALGGVLGAAFVLSWSLPLVVVAHYVVNALEFLIHEGLEIEWV